MTHSQQIQFIALQVCVLVLVVCYVWSTITTGRTLKLLWEMIKDLQQSRRIH